MRLLRLMVALAMTVFAAAPPAGAWSASGSTTDAQGNTVSYNKSADGTTTKTVTSPSGDQLSQETLEPEPVTKTKPREPRTEGSTTDADGNTVSLKKNPDGTWTRTVTSPEGDIIATKQVDELGNPTTSVSDATDEPAEAPAASAPEGSGDRIVFEEIKQGPVTANVGLVGRREGNQLLLIVSILALGPKGPSMRTWQVASLFVQTAAGNLRPIQTEPYYVARDALQLSTLAMLVFAVVGMQHALAAQRAVASEGEVCPVTGEKLGHKEEKGRFAKEVDRQGMAGTMALLTSQAKGEVTGQRATFDVTDLYRVPMLRDIPVIARLFNTRHDPRRNPSDPTEVTLKIFVKPTIIPDSESE